MHIIYFPEMEQRFILLLAPLMGLGPGGHGWRGSVGVLLPLFCPLPSLSGYLVRKKSSPVATERMSLAVRDSARLTHFPVS